MPESTLRHFECNEHYAEIMCIYGGRHCHNAKRNRWILVVGLLCSSLPSWHMLDETVSLSGQLSLEGWTRDWGTEARDGPPVNVMLWEACPTMNIDQASLMSAVAAAAARAGSPRHHIIVCMSVWFIATASA